MTHPRGRLRLAARIPPARARSFRAALSCAALACLCACATAFAAATGTLFFDLPADSADRSLKRLAERAGIDVVFSTAVAAGIRTTAVRGDFTPLDAARRILAGTPLRAEQRETGAAIVVSRAPPAAPAPTDSAPVPSPDTNPTTTMSPRSTRTSLLALLGGLLAVDPARAQAAAAPAAPGDDVVRLSEFQVSSTADKGYRAGNSVSATRIDTPIKDLPFAISAFTPQFIEDIAARDLFDVVQFAPSVTNASVEFGGGNTLYAVRGFNQYPQRNGFVGESYVDTATIERVEVVKGPASMLYGQVAPGGTVNYITKRPGRKASTTLTLAAGTDSFRRSTIDVNQPLVKDKLLFRFNGSWENDIEFFVAGRARSTVVAPVITWRATERVAITIDYQDFRRNEGAPFGTRLPTSRIVAPLPASGVLSTASVLQRPSGEDQGFLGYFPLPRTFNISSANDKRYSEFEALNAELNVKLSDTWTARANFNWNKNKVFYKLTGLGQINVTVPAKYFPAGTPIPTTANAAYLAAAQLFANDLLRDPALALTAPQAQMQRRIQTQSLYGHGKTSQVEVAGKFTAADVELKPLFGVFYQEAKDYARNRQAPAAQFFAPWNMFDPRTWNYDTNYDHETIPLQQFDRGNRRGKAAYGVLNFTALNHRLFGVAGFRYNKATGSNDNYLTPAASIRKQGASKTVPQFGLGWKLTPDAMIYASYSESFQASVANLQVANVPSGPARPATAKGYEAGLKTDFLGGRVSSTIAVFTTDLRDRVIGFNTTSPAGLILVNTMQGTLDRSQGIELEVTWSPLDNLQVFASGSINDVKVKQTPAGADYLIGARPESSARELANLWARYTVAGGDAKGLWFGGGFNYTGEKPQRVNNPKLFLPPHTLLNAAIGYDWKWNGRPMKLTLNGTNLADKEYTPAAFLRGRPRELTLTLSAKY